ncbi:EI24 domain-containing protein [Sphingomonas sp. RP10(2022)]|uniref:EI24 domain-containing protein n=1 Tax=Sphingomonas liriopis TaxID=2949094 RepID=A0A9X2HS34_9SPHN|nr:EI24 domain-containing protein [Sphingomonas liriopis]MCP3735497.1 EI24 domain-containing protein [Sphingomonas liriopis]
MLRALSLSVAQLGDAAILKVLAKSLAVTLAIFVALGAALFALLHRAFADLGATWGDGLAGAMTVVLFVLAAWLLFRVVAIAVIGLFGDAIVAAVEARHYPAAHAAARDVGFARSGRMALGSAARAVAINLAMAPVYLVLLFTAVGPAIAFFLVNALLLGRDLGDMVASRHMDDATMRGWRTATRGWRFALGLAATGLFVVPVLNLLAPILGAAMATHLFHASKRGKTV